MAPVDCIKTSSSNDTFLNARPFIRKSTSNYMLATEFKLLKERTKKMIRKLLQFLKFKWESIGDAGKTFKGK